MNVTGNVSSEEASITTAHVLSAIAMALLNLVAFVANLGNVVVILKSSSLRHTLTNLFVLNLCVVDLLASVLVLPVSMATFVHGRWPMDATMCSLNGFINSLLTFASITNLCVISGERYYSIRLPMHHAAHLTLPRTLLVIFFTWVESAVFASLPLVGLSSYKYRAHKKHCSFTWQEGNYSRIYVLVVGFWCFLLPGVVLLVMYYGIFKVARMAAMQVNPQPAVQAFTITNSNNSSEINSVGNNVDESSSASITRIPWVTSKSKGKHYKAIKTLIIILSAYIALWGPYFILHIHGALYGSVFQREQTEILTTWLGYTSFGLNPFLYGWMNRSIREELRGLYTMVFCCTCFKGEVTHSMDENPGENFLQFLERTSARHEPAVNCVADTDTNVELSELFF